MSNGSFSGYHKGDVFGQLLVCAYDTYQIRSLLKLIMFLIGSTDYHLNTPWPEHLTEDITHLSVFSSLHGISEIRK